MSERDHWHPVQLSAALKKRPIRVRFQGEELCLFRTSDGQVGALADRCPHRGMRLSEGAVVGTRIQCPYHGWCYSADGKGESPGTPRLQIEARSFETREYLGAVWIKAQDVEAEFPTLDVEDFLYIHTFRHRVRGPLELVLDNFSEVEHTPTTHAIFGYAMEGMEDVTVNLDLSPSTVVVTNRGPQRRLPWWLEGLMGVYSGDTFVDHWVTRFSPVYSVFDHWWENPADGSRRDSELRTAVFFTPVDEQTTDLFTFFYARRQRGWRRHLFGMFKPMMIRLVDKEVRCDQALIEKLASSDVEMRGMKLSRFDKALAENRKRITALYRGPGD